MPASDTRGETQKEEIQWDFYGIFPNVEVPVADEYAEARDAESSRNFRWILQAGSFKNPDDADSRRANLILMGLGAETQQVDIFGDTWYRVMAGPFDSELERDRAQSKLAQEEIPSIPMKVPKT